MSALPHAKKLLLLFVALPLLLAACAKPQQGMQMPPAPVVIQEISSTTVADMSEYVATLISRRSVTLQSQVAGQVKAIYVQAGDYVSQGAPLLLVDPARQQAAVSSAAAAAQSQRAQIAQARETLRVLEEQRIALQSAVDTAQSQFNRYQTLVTQRSASQQDVERYRNELTQAQANLQANQAQIAAQQAAVKTAQQVYEQAQASTREQQVQLQYHRIVAPFSGVVGDIPVKLGNYVQPLTDLLSVTDNDPLEVNISVPAERTLTLRTGLPVEILGEDGSPLGRASLSFVSPQVDEDSQTVLTKATLANPGGRLKADQIVNARIIWKTGPGIRIPTASVVHMGGRDFVYVAESAGSRKFVARQKPIALDRIDGSFYIVRSGLKAGDRLIVSGIQKLADGAPVIPNSESHLMFVDFFIKRPIFASVCSLIIILAGLVSIPLLPIAQYPEIAPPQVTVFSNYIGASAEVVESAVTVPLEQEINGVEGMKYMTSTSSNDGTSSITITFDIGRDIDDAVVDVENRVTTAYPRLPDAVKSTGVTVRKSSPALVLVYGLYADKGQYDNFFLSNYADRYIVDALKRIKGVGEVRIFGERKYAMRLWLDPNKLSRRNLTANDVVNALREQNVQVAAGQIGQPPNRSDQAYQMSIRALGRMTSVDQFENMVIKTNTDGSLIRLKDVGRAELGAENYGSLLRFNGRDAVGLGIFQLPSANALDLGKAIKAEMARLSTRFPPGLKYVMTIDTTRVIQESLNEVVFTLAMAILLVVGVIYLFLQNWRSTIIPVITIPVSLVGTFFFMKLFGFSINTLTLFGLTLATGLVVDDAIIVIENIERFIQEKGMSPMQAASEAMKEVYGAVIATSLVLVAVFGPVAFFPGTTGLLYKQFALTIAFSIAISAFNALTLTPALSALILKQTHPREGPFFRKVNQVIHAVRSRYHGVLHRTINWRMAVMAVFAVLLAATFWLFKTVPSGFIPNEDQGYFIVTVQGPEGTSLNYTQKIMDQAVQVISKAPEVKGMFSVGGFSFAGSGPNKGMMFVALHPLEHRKGKEHSASAVVNALRGRLMGIPGAMIFPFEPPAIRGVGSFGGFQFEVQEETDRNLDVLFGTIMKMTREGNQGGVLNGLFSSFTVNDPQLRVTVDRFKAKALNVNLQELFNTMQVYLGSQYVNDFDFMNRIYRVYVQADQKFRSEPSDIEELYVRSTSGRMIPMSNLVTVERAYSPQIISHYNMFRSAEIQGSPAPGHSSGDAILAMQQLAEKHLPAGMRYEWSGIALEQIKSGQQAVMIFALSFLFVFLVLAAQYESWLDPLIIMLAVPLAIFGALGAQALRGLENDVFCQIGLVMLIGLASKNAILIVEFANQLRGRGLSIVEAAIEAARIRFRPILMTSLAFILGILPLVVASGAGSAARHSMGTAVFGGMIVSTALNLFLVPVLYVVMSTLREKLLTRRHAVAVEEPAQ